MNLCCRRLRPLAIVLAALTAAGFWSRTAAQGAQADAAEATRQRIAALIRQLGDRDYFARERAQEELARLGVEAFDALADATNDEDMEVADRAKYLIRQVRVPWAVEGDPAEVKQILQDYATANEAERLAAIKALAAIKQGGGLAALARLVRFESSQALSKQAAAAILQQPVAESDWPAREAALEAGLGSSPRVGATWLRTLLKTRRDPAAAAAAWGALAAEETRVLNQFPRQSHANLVIGLFQREVLALVQLGRTDEALAAMRRMIALEQQDDESLLALLSWLTEQKAWQVIEEAVARYADRFEQEPMLLYSLAEACQAQGNHRLAEETAARARKLNDDNQFPHLVIAYRLMHKGQFKWSESEYRLAIEIGGGKTLDAQSLLAEMLHDQAANLKAAEVLQEATTMLEAGRNAGRDVDLDGVRLKSLKSRMHYFFACHEESQGNRAKQLERLNRGIAEDPLDADVLIALYRHPDLDATARDKTRAMIRQAVIEFQRQIEQAPEDAAAYNQLAWLVSNTEGDQSKALEASLKSLEIKPNTAGYLDTLGRCYYAQGDFANAVKYQTQAVELEAYSGQMQRQLELFKAALARSAHDKKQ